MKQARCPVNRLGGLACLAAGWLLVFPMCSADGKKSDGKLPKRFAFEKRVLLRPQFFRQGRTYLLLSGDLVAGDFFAGLERIETSQGIEFRKASQAVTSYHDFLLVSVAARRTRCGFVPQPIGIPEEVSHLPDSLQFAAQWERGSEVRPAESRWLDTYPEIWTETSPPTWTFVYVVLAKDVPLTDHLLLSIDAGGGVILGRLAVDLQNPQLNPLAGTWGGVAPGGCSTIPFVPPQVSKVKIDKKFTEDLQRSVNAGQETWRLRPEPVAAWEVLKRDTSLAKMDDSQASRDDPSAVQPISCHRLPAFCNRRRSCGRTGQVPGIGRMASPRLSGRMHRENA